MSSFTGFQFCAGHDHWDSREEVRLKDKRPRIQRTETTTSIRLSEEEHGKQPRVNLQQDVDAREGQQPSGVGVIAFRTRRKCSNVTDDVPSVKARMRSNPGSLGLTALSEGDPSLGRPMTRAHTPNTPAAQTTPKHNQPTAHTPKHREHWPGTKDRRDKKQRRERRNKTPRSLAKYVVTSSRHV